LVFCGFGSEEGVRKAKGELFDHLRTLTHGTAFVNWDYEYLHEMNSQVLSKYDIMTVGEGAGVQVEDALKFVNEDRKELHMFFHFEGMDIGKHRNNWDSDEKFKLTDFKAVYTKWDSVFKNKGWGTVYLGNHDQSRMVSRFGNDKPQYREASSKMLYTFLLSQRATPYVYFGDEIVLMNDGRLVQKGSVIDLRERPADPFVSEFINAQRGVTLT